MEDFDATMPPKRVREPDAPDLDATLPPKRVHRINPEMPENFDPERTIPNRRLRRERGIFSVGDLIANRYEIIDICGRGAMGIVYRCFDKVSAVEVALKGLPPELAGNEWEMGEIKRNFQLVHNLHHPNIASYNTLEFDQYSGGYFLVMEYIDGVELRRYCQDHQPDHTIIINIISQIASALDYAHGQQILHRDIKPGNIMIDRNGIVKILDFGLAAQIRTSMTKVSMEQDSSGTAPYMSPEQWRGKRQSAASDQYALAVVAYEMFAGFLPFESTDMGILREVVLKETPEPLANVTPSIQFAVNKALSKTPEERFANCTAFAQALTAPVKVKSHAGKVIAAVVIMAILCGAGIGSWLVLKDSKAPEARVKEKAAVSSKDKASEKELAQAKETEEQQKLEAERKAKEEQQKLEAERKAREEAELRLAEERKAREEAERRVREAEQQRLEAERKAKEEQQRLEAERKAKEEQQRLEAERKAREAEEKRKEAVRIAELVQPLKAKGVEFSEDNKTLVKCPENFAGEIVIPSCVTTIGKKAFYYCSKLTTVTIPDSVTTIGESAFFSCYNLTSVTIPDSVTTIGDWAFAGCESLTSVTIPDSVTTIGARAFDSCWKLTSVTIPDSVTTIGYMAFANCYRLTSVTIPDSVTTIGDGAFFKVQSVKVALGNRHYKIDSHGALLTKDGKKIFYLPPGFSGHYTIPDSVTTIGKEAFADCSKLTTVTIPDSVTTIGDGAFFSCHGLTSVTIPDSVTTIGVGAFDSCRKLTTVTIPDSVTTIGKEAFAGCWALTSVTIPRDCKVGDGAFPCKVVRRW